MINWGTRSRTFGFLYAYTRRLAQMKAFSVCNLKIFRSNSPRSTLPRTRIFVHGNKKNAKNESKPGDIAGFRSTRALRPISSTKTFACGARDSEYKFSKFERRHCSAPAVSLARTYIRSYVLWMMTRYYFIFLPSVANGAVYFCSFIFILCWAW